MRIIDAFTFLNEVELVKSRLEYLNDYVTDFVVVESPLTWRHQKNTPFFADVIPTLPADIQKKIHHVVAQWPEDWYENEQGVNEKWVENGTRELALVEMKKFADPEDWVIMNDLDEFWDPEKWKSAVREYEQYGKIVWMQNNRVCFVDWETLGFPSWPGSKMGKLKDITSMAEFYCSKNKGPFIFHCFEGGWHFSKMGDEKTKAKLMGSIREWRTWETKIGMTADQAAHEIFHGGGWNRVTKKKKIGGNPVGIKGLTPKVIDILKQYPVLWSDGRLPNNGIKKH